MSHKYSELTEPVKLETHSMAQLVTQNPSYTTVTPVTEQMYHNTQSADSE